jgi:hypothetical protein
VNDGIKANCKNASSAKFQSLPCGKTDETCIDILSDSKCFILYFKKKTFVQNIIGLDISPLYAMLMSIK